MPNEVQACVLRTLSTGDQGDELVCLAVPCACELERLTDEQVAQYEARAVYSPRVTSAIREAGWNAMRRRL